MERVLKSIIVLKFGTQDDFAARLGVSRSLVSNVLHGRRELSFQEKVLWSVALGCSLDEIFPGAKPSSIENLHLHKTGNRS